MSGQKEFNKVAIFNNLTCNGLVFHPGGVKDFTKNTTETRDKRRLHGPLGS